MTWEATRSWHLMRPLVYYLVENFVPPGLAAGAQALDFSAGLGDLSRYMDNCGAEVVSTLPEPTPPDDTLTWKPGVAAGNIASTFGSGSFDLATARMVFQFPTWEGDLADPDTLAEEFAEVLVPDGHLVLAFHQFQVSTDPGALAMIDYLDLPPREGPHGETGHGLKVPMLVTTLQNRGFDIEVAEHAEPFTFPTRLSELDDAAVRQLGETVMDAKRRHLVERSPGTYDRPAVIREMLEELAGHFEFATWPIVRVVARRR